MTNAGLRGNKISIPQRFTKKFILESIEFILKNNSFLFDPKRFGQIFETSMSTKCAPPYAFLTIGYQGEKTVYSGVTKIFFQ